MPTLTDRLKPFVNQHCLLALSEKKRGLLKSLEIETRGDALPLYVFDWDDCDAELKGIICEEAGQDDFACFAVLNPDAAESDLDEIVSAENSGYFLIGDETIYIGSGELEPFTDNLDEFISGLRVRSEAELAEEEEEEGDEEESDDDEDDEESAGDEESGESGGEEPLWLRLTKETEWASISKEERWEKLKQMAQTMNWHAYDWKSSPAADLSFPDFSEEELGKKAPWLPKHYNDVREMNVCHVPDLNGIADGDERKMLATYGVPVAWPTKSKDPAALNDLLDLLDAARAEGGEKWKEAMESHGLLNDEHYLWLRHDKLGYSKQLSGSSDAVDAILKEIDAAIAQGIPRPPSRNTSCAIGRTTICSWRSSRRSRPRPGRSRTRSSTRRTPGSTRRPPRTRRRSRTCSGRWPGSRSRTGRARTRRSSRARRSIRSCRGSRSTRRRGTRRTRSGTRGWSATRPSR